MTQTAPEIYIEPITPLLGGDPVSFRMIKVEGGAFMMGSEDEDKEAFGREKPAHTVKLSTFWIGEFPVTQALWVAVMGDNPAYFPGMNRPVEHVFWEDITERFLPALNQQSKQTYRLPTEAEWEFAARGGASATLSSQNRKCKYAGSNRLRDVGWVYENSHFETKVVGLKQPNALGLYDMSGNVWEWCADWFDEKYYQTCVDKGVVRNPTGPTHGRNRVLRGGSWFYHPRHCRVSYRYDDDPENASSDWGFRLVVSSWQ